MTIEEMKQQSKELIGTNIKAKGRVVRVLYPRKAVHCGDFAIFTFKVDEVLEGTIPEELTEGGGKYLLTCKGTVPELDNINGYSITATLSEDATYGLRYELITMNTVVRLTSREDQRLFFAQTLAPTYVDALMNAFNDPIKILEDKDVKALCTVKGIGEITAYRLIQKYESTKDRSLAYVELSSYGLTTRMIDKLAKAYGSVDILVGKIKANPYILIKDVTGVGWERADQMALKAGIGPNSEERITAYFKYFFEKNAVDPGHTWVPLVDLRKAVYEIAPSLDNDDLKTYLRNAIADGMLYYEPAIKRIGLMKYRKLEENIASELKRLNTGYKFDIPFLDKIIAECEEENGFKYTDEQVKAIHTIIDNNVSLTMGMAGTGKSSIMQPVVRALQRGNYRVALVALSGKAALNLTNITHVEGNTIHKLLGCRSVEEDRSAADIDDSDDNVGKFAFNQRRQLEEDVIILDEVSMVGGEIFYNLIRAMRNNTKLIMVGDDRQLESIGLCNLLEDLKNSGVIKYNEFTKIWRQAAQSGIISDSAKIANGEQIIPEDFEGEVIHGEKQDFKIISTVNTKTTAYAALKEFKRIYSELKVPIEDILICTCMRTRGEASTRALNEFIQRMIHIPQTSSDVTVSYKDKGLQYEITYHPGDRVLITKNCYRTINIETRELEPIYNGNIGTIRWIDDESGCMRVSFAQGDVILSKELWQNMQLGYAITTHKAQGSGIPYVIAICDPSAVTLNSKEMLYTQLTRAKKYCCLVGPTKAIRQSVTITRVKAKQTWLSEILRSTMYAEVE